MPLQDHFHPPLWPKRDWHSFHNAWATSIAASLNEALPTGFFAEPNVQYGIEDIVEVGIFHPAHSIHLVAAIELVSPSNKDRPANREAFVSKCVSYLQRGVGLLIVDVVTERAFNLHSEILRRLGTSGISSQQSELYAASYHPASEQGNGHCLQIWFELLAVGEQLPILPLHLMGGPCIRVDLEASYERTRAANFDLALTERYHDTFLGRIFAILATLPACRQVNKFYG